MSRSRFLALCAAGLLVGASGCPRPSAPGAPASPKPKQPTVSPGAETPGSSGTTQAPPVGGAQ